MKRIPVCESLLVRTLKAEIKDLKNEVKRLKAKYRKTLEVFAK